ncbi:sialidase family protein [Sciscionella marina]|uniref:sialidase family protein n=1 Tax=Sciscionella marina TaxID=508770 RepID=UPI00035E1B97|nr:sialidase family protein [Sciscionella marina]
MRKRSRSSRRLILTAVLLLLGTTLVSAQAGAAQRNVLYDKASTYPRILRLAHNGFANGRILTSIEGWSGKDGIGIIHQSFDGGRTFQRLSTIKDPEAANGRGICCGAFYELPQDVGSLEEGTLLWADTVGFNAPDAQRRTQLRLWKSEDRGRSWSFVSTIATSPTSDPIWEPELEVAKDGSLVVFYSDESDKSHHDQKLVQVRSTDGVHWGGYRETVVNEQWSVRPGMASALRLPNGTYLLAYEVCNNDPAHLCSVYTRTSADGWNYGDPHDLGTLVRTPDGKYARHTPTISWSPGPGQHGTVLLMSEILVKKDGSYAPGNGNTVLGNDHLGAGNWYEMPAPVPVDKPDNKQCKNFSPSIVASQDGRSATEVTTDLDGKVCKTYYGTGELKPR